MKDIKELLILNNLLINSDYQIRVLPYLEESYFSDNNSKILFSAIKAYLDTYKMAPSKEALIICLKPKLKNFSDDDLQEFSEILDNDLFKNSKNENMNWLLDITEEFCQEKAVYNSLLKSIEIHQGLEKNLTKEVIPELLKNALSISFDSRIGLDYSEDYESQYDFYTKLESGIPFDLSILNRITNQIGLPRKALTVLLGGTGTAKTLSKCHFAAAAIKQGFNVLYLTMEMSEERIGQRIDANLFDMEHNDIPLLSKDDYLNKIKKIKTLCKGKLFIKEFPTGSATAAHFRHIIEELKRKKGIKIDLLIVDYLNICISSRYKMSSGANSFTQLKAVSEEIRGLGMEYNMACLSSAQVNRENLTNQTMGLDAVSESIGIAFTADIVLSLFRNDQLDQMNRILVTQLKNRYDDLNKMKRFLIGVNRGRMQLFDLQNTDEETSVYFGTGSTEKEASQEISYEHFKGRGGASDKPKSFSDFKY